uniref:GAGA-binding transcriptional activator n=1 Tax=Kalanchoe fedtschenkoi TaxID=63787 RepID=A0A7N0U0H1_KALFE
MDDDDGFRNWGYYEPSFKGHLNLQLMPSVAERDTKPFLPGRDPTLMINPNRGAYQHHPPHHHHQLNHHAHPHHTQEFDVSDSPMHMHYMRETWMHQRDKFMNILPGNPSFGIMPEPPATQPLHMMEQPVMPKTEMVVRMEDPVPLKAEGPTKKRPGGGAPKTPKIKKLKKGPSLPKENGNGSSQRVKPPKKNVDVVINGVDMDISNIPIPVCTCTGASQQCYRWGCGGWQSACCTTSISVYPLPMSTKRRGARIAGRKMSLGAFKKVLEKLASEGYNFTHPIDLKSHWAKHGTNKFVTIR